MSVHRIRIQADRDGDPVVVDVALPSGTPVGHLLPFVLHLIDDRTTPDAVVRGWRLDRPTGGSLLESLSLTDNEVHDGELLILVPEHAPPLGLLRLEPCREIAAARSRTPFVGSLGGVACVLAAGVAATALAWTGAAAPTPANLIVAAIGTCVTAAATLTIGLPTALGMAAVMLAAATGFLAVPSGPAAPNAFLAASAAFAAALLVQRLSGHPSPAWSGAATLSLLIAVATVLPTRVTVIGAVLATASLGLLALAPRIAVLTAGLGPERWTDEMDGRAAAGHDTLTGLVVGCAAGAATGAVLVAVAGLRHGTSSGSAIVFATLVSLALLLRSRTHAEPSRQIMLSATGLGGIASAVVTAMVAYPDRVTWLGGALVALALLAGRHTRPGGSASRMTDRLEYAVLAATVPVALWVGGAYALVGTVRLP